MLPFLGGREYWQWVMTYCRNSGDRIQPSRCHPLRSRQWWWPCLFLWFPIGRRSFSPTARLFWIYPSIQVRPSFSFLFFFRRECECGWWWGDSPFRMNKSPPRSSDRWMPISTEAWLEQQTYIYIYRRRTARPFIYFILFFYFLIISLVC
jgi:hypothetical protein